MIVALSHIRKHEKLKQSLKILIFMIEFKLNNEENVNQI